MLWISAPILEVVCVISAFERVRERARLCIIFISAEARVSKVLWLISTGSVTSFIFLEGTEKWYTFTDKVVSTFIFTSTSFKKELQTWKTRRFICHCTFFSATELHFNFIPSKKHKKEWHVTGGKIGAGGQSEQPVCATSCVIMRWEREYKKEEEGRKKKQIPD